MNNNNVYGMGYDALLTSLKFLVRDIVREELQAQNIHANSNLQFTPNYDLNQAFNTPLPMLNRCINVACKASNNCNSCIANRACIVRFDSATFDVDEFYNRYGYRLKNGMTIREFLLRPEVVRFSGTRQNSDIIKVSIVTLDNHDKIHSIDESDLKAGVSILDLKIVEINNKEYGNDMLKPPVIYIKAYAPKVLICTNSHNCSSCTEKCNNGPYVGAYVAPPTATNSTDENNVEIKFDELYPHCSSYNFVKCNICEDTICCVHPKHDNTNDEQKEENDNIGNTNQEMNDLYPNCSYLREAYYGMMCKCNTSYHTYQDWKNLGLFDLMSNGFDLMLDDERIENHEDVRFIYNPETNQYDNVSSGLTIDLTDLALSFVTHIGGSNIDDICVPTVWIRPNAKWYEKHKDVFENL